MLSSGFPRSSRESRTPSSFPANTGCRINKFQFAVLLSFGEGGQRAPEASEVTRVLFLGKIIFGLEPALPARHPYDFEYNSKVVSRLFSQWY